MENEQNNKTKWLHVRVTEAEYALVWKRFKNTTCRKLSQYVRGKLLDKHLTTYYRNQSLDEVTAELLQLRTALNHVGSNFNQAVRKLNSMPVQDNPNSWATLYDRDRKTVVEQVIIIENHMQKFAEQWLQNLKQDHL